jgi:formate hydrogenlyase transcriptional activator
MTTDIEFQKRIEEELRQSEQRWRAVFDNARVGVALMDSSLHFVAINATYEKMVGYTPEELHALTCLDITPEEDRFAFQALMKELCSGTRDRFEVEKRYRHKSGGILWMRVNGSVLPSSTADSRLWVVMFEDITERKRLDEELERERDWLRLLLDLTHQFIEKLEVHSVVDAVLAGLERRDHWEWAAILLPEPSQHRLRVYLSRGVEQGLPEGTTMPIEGTLSGKVYRSGQPVVFRSEDLTTLSAEYPRSPWLQQLGSNQQFKRGCALPLVQDGRVMGVLFFGGSDAHEAATMGPDRLRELAQLVAAALHNALRYDELASSREKLANEKNYIEEQVRTDFDFEKIITQSKELGEVLQQANTVAPTDSSVLILGETGTGKELIARAIHDRSQRRGQAFIKVDCATIPGSLLESELFGHEKGAFTGAVVQKLGRLEVADKGTLFLDEVGEIPVELQPKLLRVLQDQAFERLGSNKTRRLDVRVIAATNRDLEVLVSKGEFRADLFYRLKVFPITIPPLRDRRADIPPLVWHYVHKYSRRMRKAI